WCRDGSLGLGWSRPKSLRLSCQSPPTRDLPHRPARGSRLAVSSRYRLGADRLGPRLAQPPPLPTHPSQQRPLHRTVQAAIGLGTLQFGQEGTLPAGGRSSPPRLVLAHPPAPHRPSPARSCLGRRREADR